MNKALKRNKKPWKETRYYQQYLVKRAMKMAQASSIVASALTREHQILCGGHFGPYEAFLLAESRIKQYSHMIELREIMK